MKNASTFSCVLLGEQSLLVQCGEILVREGHRIAAVVTDDPAIARWSKGHDLRVLRAKADLEHELAAERFDYLFSITNLAILPAAVLALPGKLAVNFHDGPLPRYAGLNAPAWALMNGEPEYGITFHEMKPEIDEGGILVQRLFEVAADETSLSINTKCFEAGIDGFQELASRLAMGDVSTTAQDLSAKSYFGKFDRPEALAFLDFRKPAADLLALVRALDFGDRYDNPLAAAKLEHDGRVLLVRAAERDETGSGDPGQVLAADETGLLVAAGDSALRLTGFSTLFGAAIAPRAAAEQLGVEAGTRLKLQDDATADARSSLSGKLARSEAFWARRLRSLDPVDVPYLQSGRATGAPQFDTRTIEVPDSFRSARGGADSTVAAVAAYLGRLGRQERFHLAFDGPTLAELCTGGEAWLSPSVPLLVRQPSDASVDDFFGGFGAELERVRDRGSWLHDLIGRSPDLAANGLYAAGGLATVAVSIGADDSAPRPGTELRFRVQEGGARIAMDFETRVVDEASAAALEEHLRVFLESLGAASGSARVADLSLLSDAERQRVLRDWNDTSVDYARDRCVHELIAAVAAERPDADAVVFEDASLSYRELDQRANQLAHHLRERGVGPDRLVGIYIDRSLDMLVAMLGVHKAGGAYVPLDPAYPADRIALMIEDSGLGVIITKDERAAQVPAQGAQVVRIDSEWAEIARHPASCPDSGVAPENLAYVIYTSGSTGRPKGVMVEHRNVVNFFAGMDARVGEAADGEPGVWLGVTSLSFDISVLELLWTLARGFKLVVYADDTNSGGVQVSATPIDFGLFMWGADDGQGPEKYELMLESAKFGDANGFSSFWTPERHFHAFGGPYPNPSVTSAALAAVTERIGIRAGSVVSPLHHPVRIAEEWAVVDNLSRGRVGISFAPGWQPNDFVLRPENHKDAKGQMYRDIDTVQKLWRGEAVEFENPMGARVPTSTQPRPIQAELPVWVTTAGNPDSFRMAGEAGANLLTHLLGQTVEELADKIAMYRQGRRDAGHDPEAGIVTLMLHTLVADDDEKAKRLAHEPMKEYLRSSALLIKGFAWAFPAFKRPGGADEAPDEIDLESLSAEEMDTILDFAFDRYFETSGLFGGLETCLAQVERVKAIGVNEIGCLIDYGVPNDVMLESLKLLNALRERANAESAVGARLEQTLPAQIARHEVTHLQCTPSMARMLVLDRDAHPALRQIQHLLIGGEAFPLSLAHDLDGLAAGSVTNMYGPTETTIWSSTAPVSGKPDAISIGTPIANTQLYILDESLQPVPVGVEGELVIGGDGVVRGYHERPELTAERFVADPFRGDGARMYRTGDLARWNPDGGVHFVGRMDHQVKIRGYRIELGEIEVKLASHEGIDECIVIVREDTPGDQRLVAYCVAPGAEPSPEALRAHLADTLPDFMIPSAFCFLEVLPLTPNGKNDRKALPAPEQLAPRSTAEYRAPESDLERVLADTWKAVLKLEDVGVNDNFFDLGGHSLLVVQVHRELRDRVEQPLSLTDLYRFPTIRSLVDHLEGGGDVATAEGQDRGEKRKAALARRQRRGRSRG